MDKSAHTNRPIHETSPYLQQHARNPVDWHPWGPEALDRAKREDKPIPLSIGYSACHRCHVMEHESFEDEAVAQVMNALFVNIKVDREERPRPSYCGAPPMHSNPGARAAGRVTAPGRTALATPADVTNLTGLLAERHVQGNITAYICSGHACQTPVSTFEDFDKALRTGEIA